jgi:hypothetical protein
VKDMLISAHVEARKAHGYPDRNYEESDGLIELVVRLGDQCRDSDLA